jgi:hypothetical protein
VAIEQLTSKLTPAQRAFAGQFACYRELVEEVVGVQSGRLGLGDIAAERRGPRSGYPAVAAKQDVSKCLSDLVLQSASGDAQDLGTLLDKMYVAMRHAPLTDNMYALQLVQRALSLCIQNSLSQQHQVAQAVPHPTAAPASTSTSCHEAASQVALAGVPCAANTPLHAQVPQRHEHHCDAASSSSMQAEREAPGSGCAGAALNLKRPAAQPEEEYTPSPSPSPSPSPPLRAVQHAVRPFKRLRPAMIDD